MIENFSKGLNKLDISKERVENREQLVVKGI